MTAANNPVPLLELARKPGMRRVLECVQRSWPVAIVDNDAADPRSLGRYSRLGRRVYTSRLSAGAPASVVQRLLGDGVNQIQHALIMFEAHG